MARQGEKGITWAKLFNVIIGAAGIEVFRVDFVPISEYCQRRGDILLFFICPRHIKCDFSC